MPCGCQRSRVRSSPYQNTVFRSGIAWVSGGHAAELYLHPLWEQQNYVLIHDSGVFSPSRTYPAVRRTSVDAALVHQDGRVLERDNAAMYCLVPHARIVHPDHVPADKTVESVDAASCGDLLPHGRVFVSPSKRLPMSRVSFYKN
ncbi:hypothetical protein EBZ80_12590 [bacterium]|nr:hypothetical protein [bacterium]